MVDGTAGAPPAFSRNPRLLELGDQAEATAARFLNGPFTSEGDDGLQPQGCPVSRPWVLQVCVYPPPCPTQCLVQN